MPQRKQVNFPVKSDQLENETLKKNLQSFSIGNYTILGPVDLSYQRGVATGFAFAQKEEVAGVQVCWCRPGEKT